MADTKPHQRTTFGEIPRSQDALLELIAQLIARRHVERHRAGTMNTATGKGKGKKAPIVSRMAEIQK